MVFYPIVLFILNRLNKGQKVEILFIIKSSPISEGATSIIRRYYLQQDVDKLISFALQYNLYGFGFVES